MNQGRIWCVVNPTVGLPLFIGGVAATSLIVHASVMTHVTWMGNYWQGKAARTAMNGTAMPSLSSSTTPGFTVSVDPVASNDKSGASFVVTVAPNLAAKPHAVSVASK